MTVEEIVLKDREDEVDSVAVLEGLKDVRCLQSVGELRGEVWGCARGCADSREACGDVGDNEG